ncbi:hypothetical protein Btru_047696 [Bulinus truncatus]|nr:hypothetical protein Btru_047696 [Bulinus truncatus]
MSFFSVSLTTGDDVIPQTDGDGGNVEAKRKYIHIRPPELFMHEEEQVILSPSESRIADILSDPNYPLALTHDSVDYADEMLPLGHLTGTLALGHLTGTLALGRLTGTLALGRLTGTLALGRLTGTLALGRLTGTLALGRLTGTLALGRLTGTLALGHLTGTLALGRLTGTLALGRLTGTLALGRLTGTLALAITSLKLGKKSSIFLPQQVTTTKASKRQKTPDSTRSITLVRQLTDMEEDNTHLVMDPDSLGTKKSKKGKTDQQSIRPSVISQSDADEEQQPSQPPAAIADTDRGKILSLSITLDKAELKSHRSVRKISYPTDSRGQVALQPKKRSRRHTMVDISTLSAFSTLTDLKSPMAKPSLTSTKEEVIVQPPLEVIPETPVDTEKPVRKLAKMKNVAIAATKLREPQRKVKKKKPEAGQQKPEVKVDEESVSSMDSDNLQSMWNMLVSENPEKSARRISPDQQLDPSLVPVIEMSTLKVNEEENEELIRQRKEEIKKYWRKMYTQATQLAKTSETALTDQLAPGTKGRWDDFYIANEVTA